MFTHPPAQGKFGAGTALSLFVASDSPATRDAAVHYAREGLRPLHSPVVDLRAATTSGVHACKLSRKRRATADGDMPSSRPTGRRVQTCVAALAQ